jgi:hypothetical protein
MHFRILPGGRVVTLCTRPRYACWRSGDGSCCLRSLSNKRLAEQSWWSGDPEGVPMESTYQIFNGPLLRIPLHSIEFHEISVNSGEFMWIPLNMLFFSFLKFKRLIELKGLPWDNLPWISLGFPGPCARYLPRYVVPSQIQQLTAEQSAEKLRHRSGEYWAKYRSKPS